MIRLRSNLPPHDNLTNQCSTCNTSHVMSTLTDRTHHHKSCKPQMKRDILIRHDTVLHTLITIAKETSCLVTREPNLKAANYYDLFSIDQNDIDDDSDEEEENINQKNNNISSHPSSSSSFSSLSSLAFSSQSKKKKVRMKERQLPDAHMLLFTKSI